MSISCPKGNKLNLSETAFSANSNFGIVSENSSPLLKPGNIISTADKINHCRLLTNGIIKTFQKCNPRFTYDECHNPKRYLTFPSEGVYNDNYDNTENHYILCVNDKILSPEKEIYIILELLGKGTFGQVVRCNRVSTGSSFALKIIKNKPAYTNQALTEIKIYQKLKEDKDNTHDRIVTMEDYFVFRNHICIVFELLNVSLYDLLKAVNFKGFTLNFIRGLVEQILKGLLGLRKNKIIHCDLKPENILFENADSNKLKIVDLGSSCFENQRLYTYIQSRYYRAPEVLLGAKYSHPIDMWSFGCIVAELYLGLPIFPGNSEYDQMRRIIEILGVPDDGLLETARFRTKYFKQENGKYVFKSQEEYEKEQQVRVDPPKKYFVLKKLDDLEAYFYKSPYRENKDNKARFEVLLDFLRNVLKFNPKERITPSQAMQHPFITNEPLVGEWKPPPESPKHLEKTPLKNTESNNPNNKPSPLDINQFSNPNKESYRPFVGDIHENPEDRNKMKNVGLINNQTESNKPNTVKKKLNPNKEFIPSSYQPESPKKSGKGNGKFETTSEPGSARSLDGGSKKQFFSNKKDNEENKISDGNYPKTEKKIVRKHNSSDNLLGHNNYNNWSNYQGQYPPNTMGLPMQPPMQNFQPPFLQQGMQPGMQPGMMSFVPNYPVEGYNNMQYPPQNQFNNQYGQFQYNQFGQYPVGYDNSQKGFGAEYNQPPNNIPNWGQQRDRSYSDTNQDKKYYNNNKYHNNNKFPHNKHKQNKSNDQYNYHTFKGKGHDQGTYEIVEGMTPSADDSQQQTNPDNNNNFQKDEQKENFF
jgi:serine/threonine protein kinase